MATTKAREDIKADLKTLKEDLKAGAREETQRLREKAEEAEARPDAFNEFYTEFGIFLKEGAAMDYTHKEQLTKLLRFESSLTEKGKTTSLADYVSRMPEAQKAIYYVVGDSKKAVADSPHIEAVRRRARHRRSRA